MTFSSSPVLYPPSSSPPRAHQKRKLFQTFDPIELSPKRQRILGGFVLDDDSDVEEDHVPITPESTGNTLHPRLAEDSVGEELVLQLENQGTTTDAEPHQKSQKPSHQQTAATFTCRLTSKFSELHTSCGTRIKVTNRIRKAQQTYEEVIAQRSTTGLGRARKAYYGVDIHQLVDDARIQRELDEAAKEFKIQNAPAESVECPQLPETKARGKGNAHQMWTEKYRARKFTELVGDERTHRAVLRWLKSWDAIVFPGVSKVKTKRIFEDQEQHHKKILLLTGPPGLGKTTLAHVCAKQAGYEVLEINASDDRSRDVVKGQIKDAVGTETVRGVQEHGKQRKAGRPICVVVDEVDGVVTGSGGSGGEGGFMKALIDLVQLDQRNTSGQHSSDKGKKKGDKFRLMRPLILICNDVYAPSLRPLRQSALAEIVHVRKPGIDKVIGRLKNIFEKENIQCDNDAVRRLCESSWGLGTRKQNSIGARGAGDGDIRGVLVQGEWMAHKMRASQQNDLRLTRKWVEEHVSSSTASQDGLGRGGIREVVERLFIEGAGLPNLPTSLSKDEARLVAESKVNTIGVADLRKRAAISALRGMIDTTGEHDRLMTECFTTYPTQIFQDDTLLSKPNASYEWLHFHDMLSSKVYSGQEWELNPYLSTSACGFHDLFAAVDKGSKGWNEEKPQNNEQDTDSHPFSGMRADFAAYEAEKANRTVLTEMQAGFSASLLRLFSSIDSMAMDLIPMVNRMLAPDVKPLIVGGSGSMASVASVRKESEKICVQNAVRVMYGLGVQFEKIKIENEGFGAHTNGGYAFRMEPPLDNLSTFHMPKSTPSTNSSNTSTTQPKTTHTGSAPVRYAVRQVLSQELSKEKALQENLVRQARAAGLSTTALSNHPSSSTPLSLNHAGDDKENQTPGMKNIAQITAIAAATASLASGPGSATVLGTGPVKKDFFGRPIMTTPISVATGQGPDKGHNRRPSSATGPKKDNKIESSGQRTWVSFHEGYSNAVRKYISLKELMDGF